MQGQMKVCIQSIIYLDSTQKTSLFRFFIHCTLFANKAGISFSSETFFFSLKKNIDLTLISIGAVQVLIFTGN